MTHQIKLTKNHKRILGEVLMISMEAKEKKLKKIESIEGMYREYERAAARLLQPEIECGRMGTKHTDNFFGWFIDQIHHSGKLDTTELGKLAIDICEACGGNTYENYCRITIMNTLFE